MFLPDLELSETAAHIKVLEVLREKNSAKIRKTSKNAQIAYDKSFIKPRFSKNLQKLMLQISGMRAKELSILSKIDEMEKKHRFLKKEKRLKKPDKNLEIQLVYKRKRRKNNSLWTVLLWLWLFSKTVKLEPKQGHSLS